MEQLMLLKLELANAKADADRANWKCRQLEQNVLAHQDTIQTLSQENKQLKIALKEAERKFYVMSSVHSSSSNGGGNSSHNIEGGGCDTSTIISHHSVVQQQPYRTIHETNDDDDDIPLEEEDDNITEDGGDHRRGSIAVCTTSSSVCGDGDRSVSTRSHQASIKGAVATGKKRNSDVQVVEFANISLRSVNVEDDEDVPLDDIDIHPQSPDHPKDAKTCATENTSLTTSQQQQREQYPADDPFATLNEDVTTREQDYEEKPRWWGW